MQIGLSQLVGGLLAFMLLVGGAFSMGMQWKGESSSEIASAGASLEEYEDADGEDVIPAPKGTPLYKVLRVVDGDTIAVEFEGKSQTVRLIGVDTPELNDSRTGVQCFAQEAGDKVNALMVGTRVQLEFDPTQGERDKYKRLLAYVFREDGLFLNRTLISEGFAHEYTYDDPYKYQKEFKMAQIDAKEKERGLWAPDVCPSSKATPRESVSAKKGAVLGTDVARAATSPILERTEQPEQIVQTVHTALSVPESFISPQSVAPTPAPASSQIPLAPVPPVLTETTQSTPTSVTPAPSVPSPAPTQTTASFPICSVNTYNCTNFKTQKEAQDVYNACGGLTNDVHKLDKNKDGHPCDSLPE